MATTTDDAASSRSRDVVASALRAPPTCEQRDYAWITAKSAALLRETPDGWVCLLSLLPRLYRHGARCLVSTGVGVGAWPT